MVGSALTQPSYFDQEPNKIVYRFCYDRFLNFNYISFQFINYDI